MSSAAADRIRSVLSRLGPLGDRVAYDHPIGVLTTYRVGGHAAAFAPVEAVDEVVSLGRALDTSGIEVVVIGRGSNLLVADGGFDGLAVQLGEGLSTISVDGVRVRVGGSASLPVVARRTAAAGLTGLEWAVGVPGSMGGAVRMNAGGHGSDLAAVLRRVRVVDLSGGEDVTVAAAELEMSYRRSSVSRCQVVVEAELELSVGSATDAETEIAEIVGWRRRHQPGGQNAGSVFTNPADGSAGWLIERVGCKGLRIGTAEVSTKHANFIQADADGRADDVVALMVEVRRRVFAETGVQLEAETKLVGFPEDLRVAAGASE